MGVTVTVRQVADDELYTRRGAAVALNIAEMTFDKYYRKDPAFVEYGVAYQGKRKYYRGSAINRRSEVLARETQYDDPKIVYEESPMTAQEVGRKYNIEYRQL